MSNILVTANCNRSCSFCFARKRIDEMISDGKAKANMTRDDMRKIMNFQDKAGDKNLKLLGGEPTMYPEFIDVVKEALERGFHIHLFSNCIMSAEKADFLGSIPKDRLSVLANVSPQANDTERQIAMRTYAIEKLGDRAALGITITAPEFEFEFLIDYIKKFGLSKSLRVGIAQPIVGQDNDYLAPSDYPRVGAGILKMAQACVKDDILIGFDCGLTLCMFTEEQLGKLATCSEGFKSLCAPIIDIGPNMEVWSCFPLSEVFNTSLDKFEHRSDLVAFYNKLLAPYHSLGCMPRCLKCDFKRRGQCGGGCLAHVMNSLNKKLPRDAPAGE
ncbi:MAG: radical SAM protein [Kiritimatiellae bacterium]|nr:radical SAM protein [Kiritimatiellia bacterium]